MKNLAALGLVFVLLIVSGCTGSNAGPAGTQAEAATNPDAPTVEFDETHGTVHGVVTDEELAPIFGARLTLLEANLVATTGSDGMFVINKVLPGSYQLFVEALGYQSIGRKAEVTAGPSEALRFTLALLPVITPYVEMIPKRGYSICDLNTVYLALTLALPGCEAKATMFDIPVNETWAYGITELRWAAQESMNLVSDTDNFCLLDNSNPCFVWKIGRSPMRFDARPQDQNFSRAPDFLYPQESFNLIVSAYSAGMFQQEIQGSGTCLRVGEPPCGGVGLSLGTTFDLYVSIFHHEEPVDVASYSAVPDG